MHPGAEDVYGANVYEPSTENDLHAYVECGLYDLSKYLAERSGVEVSYLRWTIWLGPKIKLYRTARLGWMGDQFSLRWDTHRVHANVHTFHFLYFKKGDKYHA